MERPLEDQVLRPRLRCSTSGGGKHSATRGITIQRDHSDIYGAKI
jgi:hypothetical protein